MQHDRQIKLVMLGDYGVGKTCMLMTYTSNAYPTDYIPTVFDNYVADVAVGDQIIGLALWDTAGQSADYDRLRPLSYPQTDVFVLCFSINNRESFAQISTKWVPEIAHHCPKTPFIIVGTRIDLRHGPSPGGNNGSIIHLGPDPVSTEEGKQLARQVGANYVECSSLTQEGLKEVFDTAIKIVLFPMLRHPPPPPPPKPDAPVVSPLPFTEARFASLVNKKQFSDVAFRLQDKELYAHKVVLSASSPLFQKMFVNQSTDLPAMFTIVTKTSSHDTKETKSHQKSFEVCSIKESVPLPPFHGARYGATASTINGVTYIIGGADIGGNAVNNVLRFDGSKWLDPIALTNNGTYPQGNLHSSVVKDHMIYVFGGKSNKYSNSTFAFNTTTLEFAKLDTKGIVPAPRYGHSAVLHDNEMIVFGGYDNEGGKSNELFVLNLTTNTWNQVPMTEQGWPSARYNHHAVTMQHKKRPVMIVFGGTNGTTPLNEALSFDLTTKTWIDVKVKGDIPEPRTGFAMTLIDNSHVVVHGGQNNKENKDFSDVFILNTRHSTLKWTKLMFEGEAPSRLYHAASFNEVTEELQLFCGKFADTVAPDAVVLQLRKQETTEWKREEHVTIEVKDMSYEAFLAVLVSCYTALPPTPQEFSVEAVKEGLTFFQRYPRFTSDERNKFLLSLAENDCDTNNNNTNNNDLNGETVPLFADVCAELPSKKREYCHKALLAAGSDYFSKLLANSEQNNTIKINLSDLEFSSIKRFLYTGTVNFTDKSFEYSRVVLPKLVKMNLLEYASHCECHLRDLVRDADEDKDHLHVFNTLQLAEELNLNQLRSYCIWWMQVHFDTISEQSWFKNDLKLIHQDEVERGKYPDDDYRKLYLEWQAICGKKGKKKDCIVQ